MATDPILVTGGTGFVGIHVILRLLQAGHQVRTTVRSLERETEVRGMLRQAREEAGDRLSFARADLMDDEGWDAAVTGCRYVHHVASPFPAIAPKDENELILPAREGTLRVLRAACRAGVQRVVLTSSFAAIDCLYNNAGYVTSEDKSVLETDSNVVEQIFKANFLTAWLCCNHGIPYMVKNQPSKSSVVNVSSFLSGMGSATGQMAYNAAKAAVAQFTRDLGTNLAKRGVRVNALALGPIETPQLAAVFTRIGEEERRRRFTHMPFGRFGTLEELAGTVAYLFSEDAGFITGSLFPLDGGIQNAFTVAE